MTEQVSDQSYFNIILFMVYPFLGKYLKSFSKQHKDIHKEIIQDIDNLCYLLYLPIMIYFNILISKL